MNSATNAKSQQSQPNASAATRATDLSPNIIAPQDLRLESQVGSKPRPKIHSRELYVEHPGAFKRLTAT